MAVKNYRNEYLKERRRVQQAIRRQEQRGYLVNDVLPDIPEKITKRDLNRLKKITPQSIRNKSDFLDFSTGEIIPSKQAQEYERDLIKTRKRQRKADRDFFDSAIIGGWQINLHKFRNAPLYELMSAWLQSMIAENGKHNVAIMLQKGAENGLIITYTLLYKDDGSAMDYINHMMEYMPDQGIFYRDQVLDRFESASFLNDIIEDDEDFEADYI